VAVSDPIAVSSASLFIWSSHSLLKLGFLGHEASIVSHKLVFWIQICGPGFTEWMTCLCLGPFSLTFPSMEIHTALLKRFSGWLDAVCVY
jgi:hypothetical protein